jgi:hypothetical protein
LSEFFPVGNEFPSFLLLTNMLAENFQRELLVLLLGSIEIFWIYIDMLSIIEIKLQ